MTLFNVYLFVDWSAANRKHPVKPKSDTVWVGQCGAGCKELHADYYRTRVGAIEEVTKFLVENVKNKNRVLVGFDFPYGYPTGFAAALGLQTGSNAWRAVWDYLLEKIQDNDKNQNNRFTVASDLNHTISGDKTGPFWGCPVSKVTASLSPFSPGFPFESKNKVFLKRSRLAEDCLRGTQETWKLYGIGSVGSQALTGIPYVHQLRNHPLLSDVSQVWPFETGFTSSPDRIQGPFILHAEIWPGILQSKVNTLRLKDKKMIKDCAQVRTLCEWAADEDRKGTLGQFFAESKDINPEQVRICTQEEGWILGARFNSRFHSLLDAAEKRIQETGGLNHEDVWANIESKSK